MIKLTVGHPAGNEVHLSYRVLTETLHYKILKEMGLFLSTQRNIWHLECSGLPSLITIKITIIIVVTIIKQNKHID